MLRSHWTLYGTIAVLLGCSASSQSLTVPERFPPDKVAEVALSNYDANHDDKIAGTELDKSPALKSAMPRLDTDRDKAISRQEIIDRIQAYETQSKLVAAMVQVFSNGRALEGATVTIEPESFMGDAMESYTVKTDSMGSGAPRIAETGELKTGLPLGFYRVTITHPSHSGKVERGCEVADDASGNRLMFSMDDQAPPAAGGFSGR